MNNFLKLGVCGIAMRSHYGNETYYLSDEVDAALAAKDAELERLKGANRTLGEQLSSIADRPGKSVVLDAPPHPDTARLDKLPALRDLVDRVWNEATESEQVPSTDWADRIITKWIDSHQEPKP